jgi:hypothetical protein
MPQPGWLIRKEFSLKMQKVAIEKYYPHVWAEYKITEIDELDDDLAIQIDIGGGDKMLVGRGGHIAFVGQRFRKKDQWDKKNRRDFTIREAEYDRHLEAIRNNGFIPGHYVLGYANENEDDFMALYIIDYRMWLEDILSGKIAMTFLRTRPQHQENFYYYPLNKIPEQYIEAKFVKGQTEAQQLSLL